MYICNGAQAAPTISRPKQGAKETRPQALRGIGCRPLRPGVPRLCRAALRLQLGAPSGQLDLNLVGIKPLGKMILLVVFFAVLGRFSARVGPKILFKRVRFER